MKKLKTTHVEYKPSGQLEKMKPYVRKESEEKPVHVAYRGDDLTYGRVESSRKLPSTYKPEQSTGFERITVEEITFPRKTTETLDETYQVNLK